MKSLRHKFMLFLGRKNKQVHQAARFRQTIHELTEKKQKTFIEELLAKKKRELQSGIKQYSFTQDDMMANAVIKGKLNLIKSIEKELEEHG